MNRRPLVRLALALVLLAPPALAQNAPEPLDRPARRLQISVRFDGDERIDQRVQVLEGSSAVIYSRPSGPVRGRIHTPAGVIPQEVTVVHERGTGFRVVPRLSGKTVRIEIAGRAGEKHTETSAQAELGQWIRLRSAYRSEIDGVWLKLEESPH